VTWQTGLDTFLNELADFYSNEQAVNEFLRGLAQSAAAFAAKAPKAEEEGGEGEEA
jgi:hypothetical protein